MLQSSSGTRITIVESYEFVAIYQCAANVTMPTATNEIFFLVSLHIQTYTRLEVLV